MLELIPLTLVCGLVDSSLFTFLLKLLQWGLASINQGKLESPLIKVSLRMTFLKDRLHECTEYSALEVEVTLGSFK